MKRFACTNVMLATFFLFSFAVTQLVVSSTSVAADKVVEWKVLASWSQDTKQIRNVLFPWMDMINDRLKGKMKVSWSGPEAVPPFEQLKPLRDGIFDVLFTHSAYHAGDISLGMGLDLFTFPAAEKRKAGSLQVMDEAYRKTQNIHYLGAITDGTGYHLMLRDKCITTANLKGLKLRSNPFYDPLLTTLGAATVRIAGGEVYSALEKGVVDGSTWPAIGALDFKWYEVAKYQVRPLFGDSTYSILVNLDSWNRIPEEMRNAITEIEKEMEVIGNQNQKNAWKGEEGELIKRGMNLCELPPAEAKKFLDTFYTETWKFILKLNPEYGPRLKATADKLMK